MASFPLLRTAAAVLAAAAILSACKKDEAPPAPPPEAAYIVVDTEKVTVKNELPGRIESYRTAEVRARVPGIILKRAFEEGSNVMEGQLLFQIDPRDYKAAVQAAEAALARAQADEIQTGLKLKRYTPLVKINAVSKQDYDDVLAAHKQAVADVNSAKAELVRAKLNVEYARVESPISGRIGRQMVTEGALVGQNETTLLATVQQINPIYLNVTQSSAELIKLRKRVEEGALKGAGADGLEVTMVMEDGTVFPHKGKLLFSDITVDPSTGEVTIRALFPNPDYLVLPGMFVRAHLNQAVNENAVVVPQQALIRGNGVTHVLVINKEGKAERRKVVTGATVGNRIVISEGLQPGEQLVVEGLQKIKVGAAVRPVVWVDPLAPKPEAAPAEGENAEGAAAEGQKAEGTAADAKPAEAKEGDAKAADAKASDAKPADAKEGDAKAAPAAEAKPAAAETKAADAKPAEEKPADAKAAPAAEAKPAAAETKAADAKPADAKAAPAAEAKPAAAETKAAEEKPADTKAAPAAEAKPAAAETKAADAKTAETKPAAEEKNGEKNKFMQFFDKLKPSGKDKPAQSAK